MLEIKILRENLSNVEQILLKRGQKFEFAPFLEIDDKRRKILHEIEDLRHKRNVVSDQIAKMKKSGENADDIVAEMRQVSARVKELDKELNECEAAIRTFMLTLPNLPHSSVPEGKNELDNVLVKQWNEPEKFDFKPKAHWTIGEDLGILDFETASKITGSRFPLYKGMGAKLERAIISFMIDVHTEEHGYTEVLPPFMVNRNTITNTGQLPKFEEDLFKVEGLDYFLIPTAEVPVTNIHMDQILSDEDLPIYYTACTPCFRSEAGSYGKDTRGLIRQHQFSKVEMVKFSEPETSYDELEKMTRNAETILEKLGLPYQTITLCTGDMGFAAAKTYDVEVWMPEQDKYREISSCSNCEDFQSRRANIRFRKKGIKGTRLVHTLNGSGLAVGRTFAAILENYQQKDGSVIIPEALRPYMGGKERI